MNEPLPGARRAPPTLLYAVAIFLSSSLLFLIEPIAGKRLLPQLGGSAAVWTACLVFFQCALLLGYLTAHWLVTRTGPRAQAVAYVALLVASLAQLAVAINPNIRANSARPISSVLWVLTLLIGLPFITLSATSPLLQAWYARATSHLVMNEGESIPQPYRLFAISNVGSLLALLVYPWLLEPRLSLHDQTAALSIGFTLLAVACGTIAVSMRRIAVRAPAAASDAAASITANENDTPRNRALWIALAACGSLLLSAVTIHISQNVATIPLLWVIPLIAYLLSFVVAFGNDRWQPRWLVLGLTIAALGSAGYLLYKGILSTPILYAAAIFCVALFVLCWFCHSELYRRRPAPSRLTTFYFCVAAGGALGAILVGVVAPTILPGNYELAFGLFLVAALALLVTWTAGWPARLIWSAAAATMVALIAVQVRNDRTNVLRQVRNFYGTLFVSQVKDPGAQAVVRTLYHGVITHGREIFRADLHAIPTTYYGHKSGVGLALDLCCDNRSRRVGVIGLGTGTIAAFGRAGDVFRFYDINPAVEPIARTFFTYLRESHANIEVVNGDARVSLEAEPPQRYDVIAVDAFSGDAIPVHLITAEALEVYRRHLTPNGVVAFHISNRYLNLGPVVQQIAQHAGMKTAFISNGDDTSQDVWTSDWILVTADSSLLARSEIDDVKEDVEIPPRLRMWTDDYNSLLPIFRFRRKEPE